jgi:hypothetical protein
MFFSSKFIQISYGKIDNLLFSQYIENKFYRLGFKHLKQKLIGYLSELNINNSRIKKIIFYKSAHLSNEIIRTNDNFHGNYCFSDIEIFISNDQIEHFSSENGVWYGKVCIMNFIIYLSIFLFLIDLLIITHLFSACYYSK